jgi:hypothetical protein
MKRNVGIIDRVVRLLIAVVLIGLYLTHVVNGTLALVLIVLAAVLLLTALIRFCPLYLPFGINTWNEK